MSHLLTPHSHDAADSVDTALESSAVGIRAVKISLVVLGDHRRRPSRHRGTVRLSCVGGGHNSQLLRRADRRAAVDRVRAWPTRSDPALHLRVRPRRGSRRPLRRRDDRAVGRHRRLRSGDATDRSGANRTLGWVAAAGLIGFVGNELVAVYRIRVGRRIGSAALVADGIHARTDGFTSLAVLFSAGGVALGFPLADPIIGLLITVTILAVLRTAARDVFRRLMDAVDPELVEAAEAVLSSRSGITGVRSVRMRWIGHRLHLDAEVNVGPGGTLEECADHRPRCRTRTDPRGTEARCRARPLLRQSENVGLQLILRAHDGPYDLARRCRRVPPLAAECVHQSQAPRCTGSRGGLADAGMRMTRVLDRHRDGRARAGGFESNDGPTVRVLQHVFHQGGADNLTDGDHFAVRPRRQPLLDQVAGPAQAGQVGRQVGSCPVPFDVQRVAALPAPPRSSGGPAPAARLRFG